jgi:hypothetical protein
MDDLTYGEMPISDPDVIGLRIRLCVNAVEAGVGGGEQQQQPLCGDYGTAEIVAVRAASGIYGGSGGGLPLGGIIAIAVFASLLALATLALAVKCCCCNNGLSGRGGAGSKKPKKISKDDITAPKGGLHHNNGGGGYNGGGINTIGGGYGGMDNKGVSAKDLADSPDIIKSQLYGYNYGAAMPAAQVAAVGGTAAAACDQSSSNSNNGGSVNSQVSFRFFLLSYLFECLK